MENVEDLDSMHRSVGGNCSDGMEENMHSWVV